MRAAKILETLACGSSRCPCQRSKQQGHGNTHCPVHWDPTPSLTVTDGQRVLVHCKAGCPQDDVIAALRERGLWSNSDQSQALVPVHPKSENDEEPTREYYYRDPSTYEVIAVKGRWDRPDGTKTFRWRRPDGTWKEGIAPLRISDLPLYGAELVLTAPEDEIIYFVEGEKAAEACWAQGLHAVTAAGGSGTKDFGDSLAILRGKTVALWPDNDAPGRAHMGVVAARLRDIAAKIVYVNVPLPPKGDAYDYFEAGGSKDGLLSAAITGPVVDILADDALRVRLPSPAGEVSFTFTEIEAGRREFQAECTVQLSGPAVPTDPYSQRINLLSSSARTEMRRDLEQLYGKELNWTGLLNTAFNRVRSSYWSIDRSVDVATIVPTSDTQAFAIDKVIPENQATILFGDGSAGKSYLAITIALCYALGSPWVGWQTRNSRPVLFLDYETDEQTFLYRVRRAAWGLGLDEVPHGVLYYWPARGLPLHELASALKKKITEEGIGMLIVDSAGPACGGRPEDSDVTMRYFQGGLAKLGVTSFSLAHINNEAAEKKDTMRPFGSRYWHHLARRTWFVRRVQDEDSDVVDIGVFCRKVNDGRLEKPFGVRMTFADPDGPVSLERADLRETPELDQARSLQTRVYDLLAERNQAMTVQEIAEALDEQESSVKAMLNRANRLFVRLEAGGGRGKPSYWGLKSDREKP